MQIHWPEHSRRRKKRQKNDDGVTEREEERQGAYYEEASRMQTYTYIFLVREWGMWDHRDLTIH